MLRVRLKQIVHIGLEYYITQGEKLIFQFPQPRIDRLTDRELQVLGSIIHHAYVQGDYSIAEVEVADLGRPERDEERDPCVRPVPRADILALAQLTEQIEEVYQILHELTVPPK